MYTQTHNQGIPSRDAKTPLTQTVVIQYYQPLNTPPLNPNITHPPTTPIPPLIPPHHHPPPFPALLSCPHTTRRPSTSTSISPIPSHPLSSPFPLLPQPLSHLPTPQIQTPTYSAHSRPHSPDSTPTPHAAR